jgi:hypothetical protein
VDTDSQFACDSGTTLVKPINIAVTGAGGQIGYSLIFRLAAGELLGLSQSISLKLLSPNPRRIKAILMELVDCAYPLLHEIIVTDNPWIAFSDIDYAFLVGAKPRIHGMLRRDLLLENAEIFREQGKAINDVASKKRQDFGGRKPSQYQHANCDEKCARLGARMLFIHVDA